MPRRTRSAAWFAAANAGDRASLQSHASKSLLQSKNEDGDTALHIVARASFAGCVADLLALGGAALVGVESGYGTTALHEAVAYEGNDAGRAQCVALLLHDVGDGAKKESLAVAAASFEHTALHMAATNKHPRCLQLLLEAGGDPNAKGSHDDTPLYCACSSGSSACVKLLLEAGAAVGAADSAGFTPLHMAAQEGSSDCIAILLKSGAPLEARTEEGLTPLHVACCGGHVGAVAALLAAGAAVDAMDEENEHTPLFHTAEGGQVECLRLLLKAGADIEKKACGSDEGTALLLAAQCNSLACVKELLDKGANVSASNYDGATALHLAAEEGHTEVCVALLRAGAAVDGSDDGETPLVQAALGGHVRCVEALIEAGAKVNAASSDEDPPLVAAVGGGSVACMYSLLQAGARIDDPAPHGCGTALQHAVELCLKRCATALLIEGASLDVVREKAVALAAAEARGGDPEALMMRGDDSEEEGEEEVEDEEEEEEEVEEEEEEEEEDNMSAGSSLGERSETVSAADMLALLQNESRWRRRRALVLIREQRWAARDGHKARKESKRSKAAKSH